MYTITREQAGNFWNYDVLGSPLEMSCYMALPKIFENVDNLYDDEKAKKHAASLAIVINNNHPSNDGEYNKAIWIMAMARAYANFLNDCHNNGRFLNPGSFYLLCIIIAKGVN